MRLREIAVCRSGCGLCRNEWSGWRERRTTSHEILRRAAAAVLHVWASLGEKGVSGPRPRDFVEARLAVAAGRGGQISTAVPGTHKSCGLGVFHPGSSHEVCGSMDEYFWRYPSTSEGVCAGMPKVTDSLGPWEPARVEDCVLLGPTWGGGRSSLLKRMKGRRTGLKGDSAKLRRAHASQVPWDQSMSDAIPGADLRQKLLFKLPRRRCEAWQAWQMRVSYEIISSPALLVPSSWVIRSGVQCSGT